MKKTIIYYHIYLFMYLNLEEIEEITHKNIWPLQLHAYPIKHHKGSFLKSFFHLILTSQLFTFFHFHIPIIHFIITFLIRINRSNYSLFYNNLIITIKTKKYCSLLYG